MNFKMPGTLVLIVMLGTVGACSDSDRERNLVNLFATASEDIISISFPETTQTTVSVNSQVDFTLQGLKSNGVDTVTLGEAVTWSLSEGANSVIDQSGRLTAGNVAESFTLTAQLGILSESLDIRVSSAKFDRVVQLDDAGFTLDMCQSQAFTPLARYVDEAGNEEIRAVDSTIINSIEWIILNQEDSSASSRAFIETSANQPRLYSLAAGDLIIRATALSLLTGLQETSADFNQTVGSALQTIKLCRSGDPDLGSCSVTSISIEQDATASVVAVGTYLAPDGSDINQNISRTSQWGISDPLLATTRFSSDQSQLDVTGLVEDTTTNLSVACGSIEQSLSGIDISQGVNLDTEVICRPANCLSTNALVNIELRSVSSLSVTANGVDLSDDTSLSLDARPAEITLVVNASFSNNDQLEITSDSLLDYIIIPINGQNDVVEEKAGSPGVFTVLGAGTARIELSYRGVSFTVLIQVPL